MAIKEYVVTDKGGKYVATTELRDRYGHTLWKKENCPGSIISSTGDAVGRWGMRGGDIPTGIGGFYFYDKGGNLIKRVELPLHWGEVSLSEDGTLLASQGTDKVVAFNNKGEELWRYEIDNLEPDNIVVSPKGNYIVASYGDPKAHKNRLFFFNRQGKLIRTFDTLRGELAMSFSPEERYLGVADYHNIYLFKTIEVTLLYYYPATFALCARMLRLR
ncbi:MAG: hypothetical protein QME81_18015, partial [bacterium]|nr:hypothetical protein [bacterium]